MSNVKLIEFLPSEQLTFFDKLELTLLLRIGTWLLIVFLIIATIIYHPITDSSQRTDMLKNFAILGGLIMILVQAN